ncbi:MAG TPA: molybdenum cofactor guanylyltransferase MobA [Alphaproteobacteria bacterium]|jgi:molybdopterin-guanine dinucleotide biosynthesis protein A|nr:molybdenum cofactor guanylyltransferase MobA [Alphaproteobacteria bacterium]HIK87808.1 molybdenum cofactor guanylyltransferase MobA [Alphaproteobacteria bacterium]
MYPGVILAGGGARRLGGNGKAFIDIAGVPLVQLTIISFQDQVNNLAINSRDSKIFSDFSIPIIEDTVIEDGGAGPLAGISSAIKWAKTLKNIKTHVAIVPVDTPLLPLDLVQRLSLDLSINNSDIIMASSNGNIYPVIGLWSLALDSYLDKALYKGVRKIDAFTRLFNVSVVDWAFNSIDPFFNINQPEDIILAEKYINS